MKKEDVPSVARFLPLDGLRGLAALGVALFHVYPTSRYLFWTWTLVDLFFVLSGFLIGSILYEGFRRGTLSLRNFWIRRILRIWPVYYIALIAALALDFWVGSGKIAAYDDLWPSFAFLQYTKYYFMPMPQVDQYIPWFGQSWSVAAEEQFYVLLPAVLMLLGARKRIFIVLAILSYIAANVMRGMEFSIAILGSRFDGLALGLVLVVLWARISEADEMQRAGRQKQMLWVLAAALVAGLVILMPILVRTVYAFLHGTLVLLDDADRYRMIQGMTPVFFAVTGFVLLKPASLIGRMLASKPLLLLGSWSYAFYMFHPILEGAFLHLGGVVLLRLAPFWVQGAYWLSLVLIVHLSKILVENYFNSKKNRFPVFQRKKTLPEEPAVETVGS